MSEHFGYMYASASPLPNFYYRNNAANSGKTSSSPTTATVKTETDAAAAKSATTTTTSSTATSTPARANSTSKAARHRTSRFRHHRTSSGSSTSRSSSHEAASSFPLIHRPRSHDATQRPGGPSLSSPTSAGFGRHAQLLPGSPLSDASSGSSATAGAAERGGDPSSASRRQTTRAGAAAVASQTTIGKLAAATTSLYSPQPPRVNFSAAELKHVTMFSDTQEALKLSSKIGIPFSRTESISSGGSLRSGTMTSSDPSSSLDAAVRGGGGLPASKPFVQRTGRTYLNDPTLPYPLPVDLAELHRQSLRTLLLIQLFGGPVCSPGFAAKPPTRVLEVGCGSGFWSMMCHRYFAQRGHASISFTGIDIGPMAPGGSSAGGGAGGGEGAKPDRDMRWRFVQHDLRQTPWPLPDEEFDLVMVKDMSLATTNTSQQRFVDEYLRLLRPGGSLEIWESDHSIRMLRPHAVESSSSTAANASASAAASSSPSSSPKLDSAHDGDDERDVAASLGAYVMSANTPLSPPLNNFLVEYNHWLIRALEVRDLSAVPCALVGPMLLQESESLADVRSRRLAVPLSEVRWEREGVGGVVTKDGKSYIETSRAKAAKDGGAGAGDATTAAPALASPVASTAAAATSPTRKTLTAGQAALRHTALLTVVQLVQALEPMLRDVSGKSQDEWDGWMGKMMGDLLGGEGGTAWGECLEVGAWWARKKHA